jgi:hypothetical protein
VSNLWWIKRLKPIPKLGTHPSFGSYDSKKRCNRARIVYKSACYTWIAVKFAIIFAIIFLTFGDPWYIPTDVKKNVLQLFIMQQDQLCLDAVKNGNLHMLAWLVSEGYPWEENVCLEAVNRGDTAIIEWLGLNHCPCEGKYHKYAKFGIYP